MLSCSAHPEDAPIGSPSRKEAGFVAFLRTKERATSSLQDVLSLVKGRYLAHFIVRPAWYYELMRWLLRHSNLHLGRNEQEA